MEEELKLPYAECYSLEYPQKVSGRKGVDDFVKKSLYELHPGFGEESLWDYKTVRKGSKKIIKAVVLDKTHYIERRVRDGNLVFYIHADGKKLCFFRKRDFNEKGERKNKRLVYLIILAVVLFTGVIAAVCITGMKEKEIPVQEEPSLPPVSEKALNAFDEINRVSKIINEHEGKISSVSFRAADKARLVFSLSGCGMYELVKDLADDDGEAQVLCDNVVYTGGKENFELKVELRLPQVNQRPLNETELLETQNKISQRLKDEDSGLVTASLDSASGRLSFELVCEGEKLSKINKVMNQLCLENNLFTASFLETASGEKNRFLIKADFIKLSDLQKLSDSGEEEFLSKLFEHESKNLPVNIPSEKRVSENRSVKGWKKIGAVKKDGKDFYYYRTPEGKIESSEVDYE